MLDATAFLGATPSDIEQSPEVLDSTVSLNEIGGRVYGKAPLAGLAFVLGDDGRVRTIHLRPQDEDGCAPYEGVLPSGVRFEMSRAEVRSLLGTPSASAEPKVIPGYGQASSWDRFDVGAGQVHVSYALDQRSIDLVTLMAADVVPGRMD